MYDVRSHTLILDHRCVVCDPATLTFEGMKKVVDGMEVEL